MRVQRVLMPDSEAESWTVLGDDHVPVEPIERYLAYLSAVEKSPNTVKAYAHDLKDWFAYLAGRGLAWQAVSLEDVAGFVSWLRLPPQARDGKVAVLPSADHHCAESSVNRKLAALSSFCEFHARHGVPLGGLMVTMRPALARYALGSKAPLLERAAEPKRTAMLTAVMRHLEAKAIDEALDLFQVLMATRLLNTAKRKTEKERLSTLPQLEKASRVLARAAKVLFEELELVEEQETDLDVAALWAAVEEVAPRAAVMSAAATVVTLVPEDENSAEVAMRAALANRYATVRPFLALLGESKALDAASAGKRVLAGVRALPALARRKVGVKPLLPREVDDKLVPPAWRKAVYANPDLPQGAVDRDAYVVCVLEQLHRALNNRDVFASPSHRWSNPRARLLDGPDWDAVGA